MVWAMRDKEIMVGANAVVKKFLQKKETSSQVYQQ